MLAPWLGWSRVREGAKGAGKAAGAADDVRALIQLLLPLPPVIPEASHIPEPESSA